MVFLSEPLQNSLWAQNTPFFLGVTMNAEDHQKNSQNVHKKIYVPFGVHQSLRAIDKGSPVYVFFFLHLFVTVSVFMWKSEDNFRKSILLFNHMGFKD